MARSRLEKIGTIYTRTSGLLKSGAMQWEDRPLWYDLYEKFPPKEEPQFDRPVPNMPLKRIFYEEDKIRALLHNRNKHLGTINMFSNSSTTLTKRFIDVYKKLDNQYNGTVGEEQLYEETIASLQNERQNKMASQQPDTDENEQISLVTSFKKAVEANSAEQKSSSHIALKVNELFKE